VNKAVKRAAALLGLCSLMVFLLIGYGMAMLPEEVAITGRQMLVFNAPYSAELVEIPTGKQPGAIGWMPEQGGTDGQAAMAEPENAPARQAAFKLLRLFPVKSAKVTVAKRSYVRVGGDIFGVKLYTKGVLVAKTDLVTTAKGNENPAQAAGIRSGDVITAIDGKEVNRKAEVAQAIENCGGTPLRLTVERGGSELTLRLAPVRGAADGKLIAGLWIRDSSAGIGTVTFYDEKSKTVAGLGHAICDVDSGEVIPISGGEMVSAKVMGCYKGVDGSPGELCGVFDTQTLAALQKNGETGVYGTLAFAPKNELLPVALKSEVKTGAAKILATVEGTTARYYDAEITRVSVNAGAGQKNMTIRITDPALIAATGGIVQGMSGSPIVQDGMLIGAITHVFVNTPLEGYAIFAQTMLETARESAQLREAA
jgi:stage IV sporulation protein B